MGGGGGGFVFAVPRGQRFDDPQGVPDSLTVWRGLDPNAQWNAANYQSPTPSDKVHPSAIKTEELSTAASDKTDPATLRGTGSTFFGW